MEWLECSRESRIFVMTVCRTLLWLRRRKPALRAAGQVPLLSNLFLRSRPKLNGNERSRRVALSLTVDSFALYPKFFSLNSLTINLAPLTISTQPGLSE